MFEVCEGNVRCVLSGKGRDELKPVRLSLQQLPNDRFESLAEDVYDEVNTCEFRVIIGSV